MMVSQKPLRRKNQVLFFRFDFRMSAMPDSDSSPPSPTVKQAGPYGISAPPATPSLGAILRTQIERDGPLRFTDFMATALYHPALGYYARETRQVGRGGDFFTSVSVGPLFGELLA